MMLDEIDHFAAGLRAYFQTHHLDRADEFADTARRSLTGMYRMRTAAPDKWEMIAAVLCSDASVVEKHEQIVELTAACVADRRKLN